MLRYTRRGPRFTLGRFGYAVAALAVLLGGRHDRVPADRRRGLDRLPLPIGPHRLAERARLAADATGGQLLTIVLLLRGAGYLCLRRRRHRRGDRAGRRRRAHGPTGGGDGRSSGCSDHFIICGYGRVGRRGGQEFAAADVPYVVLDFSDEALDGGAGAGVPFIDGNGTEDDDLREAGIERARGLVAVVRLGRRQPLHHALRAVAAARPDDRRARVDRATRSGSCGSRAPTASSSRTRRAGWRWRSSSLKPQVAAFLDIVTTHGGPDCASRRSRSRPCAARRAARSASCGCATRPGALIVALRKRDGTFDTTPDPDAVLEVGDVLIGVGTTDELRALEELFAPRARRACRLTPSRGSRRRSRDAGGRAGRARAPERPAHGDYATNVALRLATEREAAAARDRRGARGERPSRCRTVERAEVAGPGFVNLWLGSRWFGDALGRSSSAATGTAPARRRRASASRSRWCPRTRPARSPSRRRGTAPTATRSRGCSSSRATTSSASTTTTTPARRWSASAPRSRRARRGRSRPRTATAASTSTSSRRLDGDPVPAHARADRGVARAVPHPLRLVGAAERARASACRSSCRGSTRTSRTARSGRAPPPTATSRTACSSARDGGGPTYRAADVAYLARQARARLRPGDLRPRRRPPRRRANWYAAVARMLGYDPRPGRGAPLPARAPDARRRADEDVEAARRRRLPRRASSTRSASTPRAGTSSTAAPTRRSRSTSTSPPRRRRRTRSTTCSTRTRASPASCATRATRPRRAEPRRPTLAAEERDLVKRLAEFPGVVAEATERRGAARAPDLRDPRRRRLPPLLPRAPRARQRRARPSASALCRATQAVIARSLDLIGVEAPERM